jgi:osmotically-inducible protein OsmY
MDMKHTMGFSIRLTVLTIFLAAAVPALAAASDSEIIPKVRKSILLNSNYDAFDWIEARVLNGVVTLSGSVREPWRAAEYAAGIRKVPGVQRVENEIKALPLSTFDDEIRVRAARAVYGSGVLSRYALGGNPPVHFIVDNGRITLKGLVANQMDRQLVESLVRNNVLTLGVTNELQVETAN